MGWRGLFRQPLARQCNSNCCISANTENIPPGFRLPGLSSPQHNFQLTSIFLEFCQHTAGFTCPGWIFLHDRCTSAPPAFKPICCKNAFFCGIWALCAAAWADVAECVQKPCLRHAFLECKNTSWTLENPVSVNPQKQDNCKLSCIQFIVQEFMKRT